MTTKIILIRHGESEGNVDPSKYMTIPDHQISLTEKGINQAIALGKEIKTIVKDNPLDVYVSPYKRTKQTWKGIHKGLDRNNINYETDPRLREQEHTIFSSAEHRKRIFEEQKEFSKFYYRFGKGGESGADVYSRVTTFLTEIRMDRKLFDHENDCIIVAHEIALRSILMKLFKLEDEDFGIMPVIENCMPIVLNTENFKTASLDESLTQGNQELMKFLKEKS